MRRLLYLLLISLIFTIGPGCDKDKDETPPVITLKGYNPYTVCVGTPYNDPGATAEDDVDGDLTNELRITVDVDTSQPGEGTVKYEVSDAEGNKAAAVREVVVIYCK